MARRDFTPAKTLLPKLLLRLARERGDASALAPLWADAVGEVTARHSKPLYLENRTTLIVQVESPRWASALEAERAEILDQLAAHVGEGSITTLVFRAVEPK